jgi:hypothetical protein
MVPNLQSITPSDFGTAPSRTPATLRSRGYPFHLKEAEHDQVYFHCSNTNKVFVDYRGAMVDDLADARDYATRVVQSFTNERSLEDWRDWVLHVSGDHELFVVPFTFVLGKPH